MKQLKVVKNNLSRTPETATEKEEVIFMGKTTTGPGCPLQSTLALTCFHEFCMSCCMEGLLTAVLLYNPHYDLTLGWQEKLHILLKKYLDYTK